MKNTKVLGVVAVGVTALSGGIVHAEDSVQTRAVQETGTVDSQSIEVTQVTVDSAKAAATVASEQVKAQEEIVSQISSDSQKAQEQEVKAEQAVQSAESIVKEATPETISQTEDSIKETTAAITGVDKQIEGAQATVKDANEVAEANEKAVAAKQAAVVSAEGELNIAQENEAAAQAVLDGANAAELYQRAEETQNAVNTASKEVQTVEKELEVAKQADESRSQSIETASQKVSDLESKLSATKNNLNEASSHKEQVDKAVAEGQKTLTKAENDVAAINSITLSPDYVKALKAYSSAEIGSSEYAVAEQELARLSVELHKVNQFKANKNDLSTETYDLNNLPKSVLTELSLFTSDLLNQIHQQVGTAPTVVTASSIDFADKVTDKAIEDNWDTWDKSHNEEGITAVSQIYNLVSSDKVGNFYEDWAGITNMSNTSYTVPNLTLSQLKQKIYESLLMFFFPTTVKEWQHAADLAGTKVSLLGYEGKVKESYVAVDFSRIGEHSGIHFITVNDVMLTPQSDFDTTPIVASKTPESMEKELEKAQEALASLKAQQVKAQELLLEAQTNVETLTNQLSGADEQLAGLKQTPLQVPVAQQALVSSQERLSKAKAENDKAQAVVKQLSADITQKKAILEQAKKSVKEKENALAQALAEQQHALDVLEDSKKVLEAKQAVVQDLETQRQALKSELEQQQERLKQYKNAPQLLEKAKKALKEAIVSAREVTQQLSIEQKRLDELKATESEMLEQYQSLLSRYQKATEAKEQAALALKYQMINNQGGLVYPVFDETGKVIDYIVSLSQSQVLTTQFASVASNSSDSKLPETGDNGSIISILLGGCLTLLGLIGIRKNKTN